MDGDSSHPTSGTDPPPGPERDPADPTPEQLSERERTQERVSREAAAGADSEQEARVNLRRAEKAEYLADKLQQQKRADERATR